MGTLLALTIGDLLVQLHKKERRSAEFPLPEGRSSLTYPWVYLAFHWVDKLLFSLPYLPFPPCDRHRTRGLILWTDLVLFYVGLFPSMRVMAQQILAVHQPLYINKVLGSHRQLVRGPLPGCHGGWTSI